MPEGSPYPFPRDRFYDGAHHIWCLPDAALGEIALGMDPLGLESLGDLAFIAINDIGESVRRGEAIGTLEAAKMTGEIVAPVSGILAARNGAVLADPALVNRDPYGRGWLARIEPSDWEAESALLISGAGIGPWVDSEIRRYREEGWI